MQRIAVCLALFLFQSLSLSALALDVPKLQSRVTDLAGVLTPEQVGNLEAKLQELETADSTQVAVLVIPGLEGEYLEDYSIRVAEAWKLGQKGRDNGAILLVAMQDRAIRIETGYGLEEKLTDARASQIIRNDIIPRFRQGDFYGGIDAGVTGIIQTVRGIYQASPRSERQPSRKSGGILNFLIVMLFPLLWFLSATGKWGGGIVGAGAGMLLPYTLITHSLPIVLIGGLLGGVIGMFMGAILKAGAKSGRGSGGFGGPFIPGGGGFGGFGGGGGGGFGGFSGGGGGFGGGGSSGRW
ncbi:MAG: YgcG family protein [Acidobacteriota bacterium]|nr:YgcG family protein [Acidobacteriota bacterium]